MASHFLRFISVCVLSLCAVQSFAVDLSSAKYDVYIGDRNGDGLEDVYLHAKGQLILLHGDIITPIVIPPQASYNLISVAGEIQDYYMGTYQYPHSYFSSPQQVNPQLTEQQISDAGLVLLQEGVDYFIADFDSDGASDFLLRRASNNGAYIISGGVDSTSPSLLVEYSGEHAELINNTGFTIKDVNGDGSVDIVFNESRFGIASRVILGGGTYKAWNYDLDTTAALPTTIIGSSAGSFNVDESGSATYGVNFSLPAGVAGVQPSVSLSYSSQGGNSVAGIGWSLNAGAAITRCHATLFTDGYTQPILFNEEDMFCFNGQRLIAFDGEYGAIGTEYKTEMDSYQYIYSVGGAPGHPAYFEVVAKDGTLTRFGYTADSTVSLGGDILSWAMSSLQDNLNNKVSYHYLGGATNHRLDEIRYANDLAVVKFYYAERPDIQSGYINGYRIESTKRLDHVDITNDGAAFRRYQLSYQEAMPDNKVSRLYRIQECVEFGSKCLAPLEFTWSTQLTDLPDTSDHEFIPAVTDDNTLITFKPADINGDGCLDLIYGWVKHDGDSAVRYKTSYSLSTNNCTDFLPIQIFLNVKQTDYMTLSNYQLEVIDYNADGRSDIAVRYNDQMVWNIFLSEPNSDGEWRLNGSGFGTSFVGGVFLDIDGDGLIDNLGKDRESHLVKLLEPHALTGSLYHFEEVENSALASEPKAVGDFNGDGAVDFIDYDYDRSTTSTTRDNIQGSLITQRRTLTVKVQTRDGVEVYDSFSSYEEEFCYESYMGSICYDVEIDSDLGLTPLVVDFNSDGFADLILKKGDNFFVHLNTGAGFSAEISVPVDAAALAVPGMSKVKLFPSLVDYNRDGKPDLYWQDRVENTLKVSLWNDILSSFDDPIIVRTGLVPVDNYAFYDLNGDNASDLLQMTNVYNRHDDDKVIKVYTSRDSTVNNVITGFKNNFGAETHVSYERMNSSAHYARTTVFEAVMPDQQTPLTICLDSISYGSQPHPICEEEGIFDFALGQVNPFDFSVESDEYFRPVYEVNTTQPLVTHVESSAPLPNNPSAMSSVDYIYTNARVQAGGRGFLGFETLTSIDNQTGVSTLTEYHQDFPFIGRPKKTLVVTEEGEVLKMSTSSYDQIQPENVKYYQPVLVEAVETVYPTTTDTSQADGLAVGTTPLVTTTVTTTFNGYGNLESSITTTEGNSPDPDLDSGTLVLTQEKSVTNEYEGADITLHGYSYSYQELGRLSKTLSNGMRNSIDQEVREVSFTYYGNGMLKEEIVEPLDQAISNPNDPNYIEPTEVELRQNLVKKNYYDAFGNATKTELTGWNGLELETRGGEVVFDSIGRYPIETYDVYNRLIREVLAYNIYGAPTLVQDPNGVRRTITYDDLGREISRTDNTASENTVTTEYLSCGQVSPACPTGTQYAVRTSLERGSTSIEYFDRLGRGIKSAAIDFHGQWVYASKEYDNLGRVSRVSQPYYIAPLYWTTTQYDILGRALSVSVPASEQPFAVSRIEYDGLTSTTYNPDGQTKRQTKNTFGQLIKAEDNVHDEGDTYAYIRYAYNTEGDLTTTTVHKGEGGTIETSLDYDRLGRKTSLDDPDKGHWEYRYNAFGELIYQKDANLQVVRNAYDKLGRITSRIDYKKPQGGASDGAIEQATHWYFDGNTDDSGTTISNAMGQTTAVVMSRGVDHAACNSNSVQYCQYPLFDEYGRQTETTTYLNTDNVDATPREVFTTKQTYNSETGRTETTSDVMDNVVIDHNDNKIVSGTRAHYNEYGFLEYTTDLQDINDVLYRTVDTNVRGQVTQAEMGIYGRTLYYNAITGQLERQIAYTGGLVNLGNDPAADPFTIQHITYEWDIVGNLKSRHNQNSKRENGSNSTNLNSEESFCYDSLNRLVKTNIGTTSQEGCNGLTSAQYDQQYDSIGNITSKDGVGSYSYNASRPHAVAAAGGVNYLYDNNGNMTGDSARTLSYSTFDKPLSITKGNHASEFEYGPGRGRYLHIESNSSVAEKNTSTVYLGSVERRTLSNGDIEWRRSVAGSLRTFTTNASFEMIGDEEKRHIFKDHLGSVDVIADDAGGSEQRMSFNPWGERRQLEGALEPLTALELFNFDDKITSRGYTGHEMLDELGLIHMNGRIYDAKLSRFLQADPFIQAATDVQMYNRYSYVRNNPMNSTDPSGYISLKDASGYSFTMSGVEEFGFIGFALLPLVGVDGAYATNATNRKLSQNNVYAQWAPTVVSIVSSFFCGPCSIGFSALITSDINYYRSGDFNRSVHAGGVAAISASITYGIGQVTFVEGSFVGGMTAASFASKVALHAMAGGVMAKLQGGNFANGFITAGISAAASSYMPGAGGKGVKDPGQFAMGVLASAIVGGTTSKLSGGKFANGAISGAIIYALNTASAKIKTDAQKGTWEQSSGNYERVVGATGDVNEGLVWDSSMGIWERYVDGEWVDSGRGYAGGNKGNNPEGINNPLMSNVADVGPPPAGTYVAEQYTRPSGSVWVRMWPSPDNQMHGRTLFNIHGDAPPLYDASKGCPIIQLNDRLQIKTGTMIWVE